MRLAVFVFVARHFITRALLSASTFEQAQKILRDSGVGAGDGCSINMTFLKQDGDRLFHNIEMAPSEPGQNQSQLNVLTASRGEHLIHANKYVGIRLDICNAQWIWNEWPMFRSTADIFVCRLSR